MAETAVEKAAKLAQKTKETTHQEATKHTLGLAMKNQASARISRPIQACLEWADTELTQEHAAAGEEAGLEAQEVLHQATEAVAAVQGMF